jgi:6-phosphogluconolactonase
LKFKIVLPLLLLPMVACAARERYYLGVYTDPGKGEGIYTGLLDSDTGRLGPITVAAKTDNPSYLALSPDASRLYAVSSDEGGSVSAFSVGNDGMLTFLDNVSAGSSGNCYVSVDPSGRNVFAANYNGGSVTSFHLKDDGSIAGLVSLVKFAGSGPNPDRQNGPHGHFIATDDTGKFVYACDLGTDHVWSYHFDASTGRIGEPTGLQGKVPPGSGARHLAFGPGENFAYVNGEMGRNVMVFKHDKTMGSLTPIQTLPLVPGGASSKTITTAETICHPSGKWLYVSSRGDDILAVFAIGADGKLTFVQDVPSVVKFPRGFGIDPSGRWLIAAGQNDGRIAVFGIAKDTGKLTPNGQVAKVPAPVCVLFAPVGS